MSQEWRTAPTETELKDHQYFWIKPNKENWIADFSSTQIVVVYKSQSAHDRMLYGNYMVMGFHWGSPSPYCHFSAEERHLWYGPIPVPEGGDRA